MVVVEGFFDGDADGEVGGRVEGVGGGVVGFSFVCSYGILVLFVLHGGLRTSD